MFWCDQKYLCLYWHWRVLNWHGHDLGQRSMEGGRILHGGSTMGTVHVGMRTCTGGHISPFLCSNIYGVTVAYPLSSNLVTFDPFRTDRWLPGYSLLSSCLALASCPSFSSLSYPRACPPSPLGSFPKLDTLLSLKDDPVKATPNCDDADFRVLRPPSPFSQQLPFHFPSTSLVSPPSADQPRARVLDLDGWVVVDALFV